MAHVHTTAEEGVALSQAPMLQQQPNRAMNSGANGDNVESHKSRRPIADQNAFMGTETMERRASWDKISPKERAKQLEAEMLEKIKLRNEQQQQSPTTSKHMVVGGTSIALE